MTYHKYLIYGNIVVVAVLFIIPIQLKKAENLKSKDRLEILGLPPLMGVVLKFCVM